MKYKNPNIFSACLSLAIKKIYRLLLHTKLLIRGSFGHIFNIVRILSLVSTLIFKLYIYWSLSFNLIALCRQFSIYKSSFPADPCVGFSRACVCVCVCHNKQTIIYASVFIVFISFSFTLYFPLHDCSPEETEEGKKKRQRKLILSQCTLLIVLIVYIIFCFFIYPFTYLSFVGIAFRPSAARPDLRICVFFINLSLLIYSSTLPLHFNDMRTCTKKNERK